MNINPNVRHLPMLAAAIGRKLGVKVVYGNSETAATDGKTIFLPAMSAVGTEEDLTLQEGLIDHEAAHLRFTNFRVGNSTDSKLVKALRNIMEDIRIERLMAAVYPGVPANIRKALEIMTRRKAFRNEGPAPGAPLPLLLRNTLLYGLRSREQGHDLFAEAGNSYFKAINEHLGNQLVDEIWTVALQGCRSDSTLEVHQAAVQIEQLIKDASQEPEGQDDSEEGPSNEPSQDSQDQQEGSGGNEQSQEPSPSPEGNNGAGDTAEDQDGNGQGSQGDSRNAPQQEQSGTANDSSDDATTKPSKAEIAKAAQALLDQMNDEAIADAMGELSDLGDAMKSAMPAGSKPFKGDATDMDRKGAGFGRGMAVMIGSTWPEVELASLANSMVFGLDRRLETLLEAKAEVHREIRRSGMIAGHRLAKVAVGNPNVFYRQDEAEALNTAVMVVNDMSGSMKTADVNHGEAKITREHAAAAATYALTRSMGRLDIPYGVIQFTDGKTMVGSFGSSSRAVKGLLKGATGGTNTPAALRGACDIMTTRHEDRKLIILIVDGDDDVKEMEAVLAETLRRGIQIAGVFIGKDGSSMRNLFGDDMVQVTDSQDIAKALFSALENVAM